MSNYDLVIIGGSTAGVRAAFAACAMGARVALVEPQLPTERSHWNTGILALHHLGKMVRDCDRIQPIESIAMLKKGSTPIPNREQIDRAIEWTQRVSDRLAEYTSPAVLSGLGVDVIHGEGEFCRKPSFNFSVNGRQLKSRAYLLATDFQWKTVKIDGLSLTGYFTPETLGYWVQKGKQLPQHLIIIGNDVVGVELAHSLNQLGVKITLIVSSSRILPDEDADVSRMLHACLEAEGVHILVGTTVTQVRHIDSQKWVQAGDLAIEADEIVLAIGRVSKLDRLNLAAAAVQLDRGKIWTNDRLQTTNPKVYACGEIILDRTSESIGYYAAEPAVKNALSWFKSPINFALLPRSIHGQPALARVGLTERQARQLDSRSIVLRQNFQSLESASLDGKTTGFCKIILKKNGEILGACILGEQAETLIYPMAIACQQRLKFGAIANCIPLDRSYSEIYHKLGEQWQKLQNSTNFL
jgi:pyruvate/2-oxoglutarate dehydrogenase complex dihydrolipoamide dehydrogenase (E3) component